MFEFCLPLERWSWESLYGANGELCLQAIQNHSFDVYHRSMAMACLGIDPMISFGNTSRILAVRVATILTTNIVCATSRSWRSAVVSATYDTCMTVYVTRVAVSFRSYLFGKQLDG